MFPNETACLVALMNFCCDATKNIVLPEQNTAVCFCVLKLLLLREIIIIMTQ